jgi:hypothetical protein
LKLPPGFNLPPRRPLIAHELHERTTNGIERILTPNTAPLFKPDRIHKMCFNLLKRGDIRIVDSGKNLGLTVFDTSHYHQLVMQHLSDSTTYQLISNIDWPKTASIIMHTHTVLYKQLCKYIIPPTRCCCLPPRHHHRQSKTSSPPQPLPGDRHPLIGRCPIYLYISIYPIYLHNIHLLFPFFESYYSYCERKEYPFGSPPS